MIAPVSVKSNQMSYLCAKRVELAAKKKSYCLVKFAEFLFSLCILYFLWNNLKWLVLVVNGKNLEVKKTIVIQLYNKVSSYQCWVVLK